MNKLPRLFEHLVLALAGASILFAGGAAGGPDPVPTDCCDVHSQPGCDFMACEDVVCLVDPYCCEVTWDYICANEAEDDCLVCGAHPNCGNGALAPDEECDDGNPFSGDGCSSGCQLEPACDCCLPDASGPGCSSGACGALVCAVAPACCSGSWAAACADLAGTLCTCCSAGCGDGTLDPTEQCDDGNLDPGDGCSDFCRFETCGNGVVDPYEVCDDGNTLLGDGCADDCMIEPCHADLTCDCCAPDPLNAPGCSGWVCQQAVCAVDPFCCNAAWDVWCAAEAGTLCACCGLVGCGNGALDPGEQCDDGNLFSGDGCSSFCRNEICGDGALVTCEQCDDGNLAGGDSCSADCLFEICVNGVLDEGEQCDDGNGFGGDDCTNACRFAVCGDGSRDIEPPVTEPCDDGNTSNDDSCLNGCVAATCGDGFVDLAAPGIEECDDGNTTSGDGCTADCLLELTCDCCQPDPSGLPGCDDAVCQNAVCGVDPFCCSVAWDAICAAEAANLCDCCDLDGDGTPGYADDCPLTYNPGNGVAGFTGHLRLLDAGTLAWDVAQDVVWVRGPLPPIDQYIVLESGVAAAAMTIPAVATPSVGQGLYWLVRPDCPAATWSSGGPGEVAGARDAALP